MAGKGEQSMTTKRELKFMNSYMSISDNVQWEIGHQLTDFIKGCNFGGLECTVDDG